MLGEPMAQAHPWIDDATARALVLAYKAGIEAFDPMAETFMPLGSGGGARMEMTYEIDRPWMADSIGHKIGVAVRREMMSRMHAHYDWSTRRYAVHHRAAAALPGTRPPFGTYHEYGVTAGGIGVLLVTLAPPMKIIRGQARTYVGVTMAAREPWEAACEPWIAPIVPLTKTR